jgi:hypothetical protein
VVSIFFEALAFPIITKLTSVLKCNPTELWLAPSDGGLSHPFCDLSHMDETWHAAQKDMLVPGHPMCMATDPNKACWHGAHTTYVVMAMVVLPAYYFATLHYQTVSQACQSVIIKDGTFMLVAMQVSTTAIWI